MLFVVACVLCFCSLSDALLLDESGDETLQVAFHAIQQLSSRLDQVVAENQQLKDRLQTAENSQTAHSQQLASVQTDVAGLGNRVSRDYIWTDDDWILAFRATKGIGQPVYESWVNHGHHDDDPMTRDTLPCGCSTVNGSLPCDRHYRSRLLDNWPSASIDQVRLVLYENGVEKEHVTFTGTGSDYLSWFSQSRIVDSSWTDLKGASALNFFSIKGDETVKRRFFISHLYGGCPGDMGWMTVKDQTSDTCPWATVNHVPAFLYSPTNHDQVWDGHGFREADVMAVFVRFRSDAQLDEMCLN